MHHPDTYGGVLANNPGMDHGLQLHTRRLAAEAGEPGFVLEASAVNAAEQQGRAHDWGEIDANVPLSPRHAAEHEEIGMALDSGWAGRNDADKRALGATVELGNLSEGATFGWPAQSPGFGKWPDQSYQPSQPTKPQTTTLQHNVGTSMIGEVLTTNDETHEVAIDLHNFGSVARSSDIVAELHVQGSADRHNLPETITTKHTRKRFGFTIGEEGLKLGRSGDEHMSEAQAATHDLNEEMAAIARRSDVSEVAAFLDRRLTDLRFDTSNRGFTASANFNMLMDGADLSPVTQNSKQAFMVGRGLTEKTFRWENWFENAPKEEVTNFAQWYANRLEILANPRTREQFVRSQKDAYLGIIKNSGWLNDRQVKEATKRVDAAKIVFFSPFGGVVHEFGGATQSDRRKPLVALPTITGRHIVVHEFGHAFNGFDFNGMRKWYSKARPNESLKFDSNADHLARIINEGYNEHMTVALDTGSPDLLSPTERDARHIPHSHGESNLYIEYRDTFADILAGDGSAGPDSVKMGEVVDIISNFSEFRAYVAKQWGGRDILATVFTVAERVPTKDQIPKIIRDHLLSERARPSGGGPVARAA